MFKLYIFLKNIYGPSELKDSIIGGGQAGAREENGELLPALITETDVWGGAWVGSFRRRSAGVPNGVLG